MKIKIKKLIVFLLATSFVMPTLALGAKAEEDFNPNFLISDQEIQNYKSMNREDIQAFLKNYGGYISNYSTNDLNGIKRTASDIIYRASQEHKINPKYILVKLQKEQSLITDKSPSQKQLDWATGYGICDSCSMSDPALQKHKGFGVQIDSSAAIIRWYYDNLSQESWIKRTGQIYNIDGTQVRPATLATAFLYTYTPHILGNKNFWNLWQKWFDQVYPDGSLVRTSDNPTVYLIKNGEKRPFSTMSALVTRFDPKFILTISANELKNYPTGSNISLPNYSILKSGSKYYLLNYDSIRPFANYNVVKQLGYHPDEIIDVLPSDIAEYAVGEIIESDREAPLGRIVRIKENKKLYYIDGTKFHPITDENITKINFPHLSIEPASATELYDLIQSDPIKFKDGVLFGIAGSSKIYVVENGKKRHISNEDVFNGMGYKWENIIWTDQFTGINHITSEPLYLRQEIQIAEAADASGETGASEPVSNSKMIRSAKNDYIGDLFETDINTYLVADYATGEILSGKNTNDPRPMASFTKVMTAYELMKEGLNLNRSTTYNPTNHKAVYHRFRVAKGERILNKDLMSASLVSSLNTATRMLVDSVEKNESNFINRMNSQVKTWGLTKTTFSDVTGESVDNKTTAQEYLTIYLKSTKNIDVSNILGVKSYQYDEMIDLDGKPYHYDNHSNLLAQKTNLNFKILNSKTGYLDEAGAGLAMTIQRKTDNKKFVIITMGNPDYNNRFDEPERLAKWAIQKF